MCTIRKRRRDRWALHDRGPAPHPLGDSISSGALARNVVSEADVLIAHSHHRLTRTPAEPTSRGTKHHTPPVNSPHHTASSPPHGERNTGKEVAKRL